MRKIVHKLFWLWNFDKEEKWLNEMAAQGLALVSVGFCRYDFEDCSPGEYEIRMEFPDRKLSWAEIAKYVEFLEETGVEHVGTFNRWYYFRKRTADGKFRLFSDNASLIRHLTRIIRFIAILCVLNLYWGCYGMLLYFQWHIYINLLSIVNLLIVLFGTAGTIRLIRKRKKLITEQQIYE